MNFFFLNFWAAILPIEISKYRGHPWFFQLFLICTMHHAILEFYEHIFKSLFEFYAGTDWPSPGDLCL
jgi:hypothetical protein